MTYGSSSTMTTQELHQRMHILALSLLAWLFKPPGLCHSLWYAFFYKEWPRDRPRDYGEEGWPDQ